MKKILSIIFVIFGSAAFVACSEEKKADRTYEDYKVYVSEHRDSVAGYYDKEWDELENEYNEKRMKAEEKMDKWNEETKAEYAALQNDWDSFKAQYQAERERRADEQKTATFVYEVMPQGVSSDMSNVNATNLLEVHTHFVNYVDAHKDEMTREQWDRVEYLWEALGTRKNEIEKELKSGDNIKIAEQKVRYGGIKAANRPGAKVEENAEAKSK
jgi:Skp family chaperone for outer membrane proteins